MTEIWGAVTAAAVIGAGATVYEGSQTRAFAAAQEGNQSAIQQVQFGEQQQYATQLQNLIANPSQVTSLPGYQFMFDQGQQAVSRQAAAGGFLNSGNEGTALVQYGQGFATNALTQQEQLLSSLSGLSAPVQGNPVGAVNAATNATNASNTQLNNLLQQLGLATGTFAKYGTGASSGTAGAVNNSGQPGVVGNPSDPFQGTTPGDTPDIPTGF